MDNSKIIEQIKKLTETTKQKKLPWRFANANLVRWVKQDGDRTFTVTLQTQQVPQAPNIQRPSNFVLTIQATNPPEVILQVNTATSTDAPLRDQLKILFDEAMSMSQETSADIIDKLLGDL